MTPLLHALPDDLVWKIGWTLLHLLWEGVAIALIVVVLLLWLRRAAAGVHPRFRHDTQDDAGGRSARAIAPRGAANEHHRDSFSAASALIVEWLVRLGRGMTGR